MIRFVVPGKPIPQYASWSNPECKSFKKAVSILAAKEMARSEKKDAVILELDFFLPIPESWTLRRKDLAMAGDIRPTVKPDILELVRATRDALTGVVFPSNVKIVELHCEKSYSDNPRTEIMVDAVDMVE